MSRRRALIAGALALAAGCGAPRKQTTSAAVASDFQCNGRRAEYMVVNGFVAPEAGISMVCDGDQPQLISWHVDTGDKREEEKHPLSAEQFEATWEQIDATGWRFLEKKCPGKPRKGDPIFSIDVGDSATQVNLACTGKELPFPYDRLVNELDLRAAGFGNDAGDPH